MLSHVTFQIQGLRSTFGTEGFFGFAPQVRLLYSGTPQVTSPLRFSAYRMNGGLKQAQVLRAQRIAREFHQVLDAPAYRSSP